MAKNQLNILFVSHSGGWGGAQKSLTSYINYLTETDKPVLPVFVFGRKGGFCDYIRAKNIVSYETPLLRLTKTGDHSLKRILWLTYQFFKGLLLIIRVIRKHKIDLVHTNTIFNFQGAIAARIMGVKHVWHIREDISLPYFRFLLKRSSTIRLIQKFSDALVCISEIEARVFDARDKVHVIYNTWQLSRDYQMHRHEHRPGDQVAFGQIGTIFPTKNQTWFIRSFIELCKEYDHCRALLIGRHLSDAEDYYREVKAMIRASGLDDRITVESFKEDIAEWYTKIDVLVNPMLRGIVGRCTIEAMACGIPCIGNSEAHDQGILEDGKEGMLVPFNDVEALTQAMKTMMASPVRERMGARALAKARSAFSLKAYGDSLYALHRSLVPLAAPSEQRRGETS